jgi:hypothetical protein
LGSFRKIELNRDGVMETDGLKDCPQLVEAVGASVQNPQIEIQLGKRTYRGAHG